MKRRYAEPYQPTSRRESKWSVMRGMAVAIMVLSRPMQRFVSWRLRTIIVSLRPVAYWGMVGFGSGVWVPLVVELGVSACSVFLFSSGFVLA